MGRRVWVAGLLLLALAAVVWLVLGSGLLGDRPDGDGRDAPSAAGEDARETESPEGGTSKDAATSSSRVLFGRPRAERTGVGSVLGRVMDFRTGKPVAGAGLLLAGTGNGGESVQVRAKTDAEGAVLLADVPAGEGFSLRVEAEGHPARSLPSLAVTARGVTDLGTIWLGKKGALEGVVVDVEGNPVAGAWVGVYPGAGGMLDMMQDFLEMLGRLDQEEAPVARTESDRVGRFRLADLDPGPLTLLVRAPAFAQGEVQVSMTSEGAAGGEVRVVLKPGLVAGGRVVDTQGAGVGGARVALLREDDPEAFLYGRAFTETARDGTFRIDTVAKGGELTAIVAARGYPTTFGEVRAGETDAVIVVHRTVPLGVRVLSKATDAPVEGVAVAVAVGDSAENMDQPGSLVYGRTGRDGKVEFETRPGVLQMAIFSHPDYGPGMWAPAMGGALTGMMEGPKDPNVSERGAEMVFRLKVGSVVVGRVLGPASEPIAGARVSSLGMTGMGRPVVTDAEGRYRLVAPDFGQGFQASMIRVKAAGFVQAAGAPEPKPAANAAGEWVHDIRLERAAVVTGRVVDGDGAPRAGALLVLRGGGDPLGIEAIFGGGRAFSAEDGSYLIDSAGAAKDAKVVARLEGYVDSTSPPFAIAAGQSVRAPDVVMRRGAALEVRVLDPTGGPGAGARVEAESESSERGVFDAFASRGSDADVLADAAGVARVQHLAAGKVTITVAKRGFASARETAEVPDEEGAERSVEVRLRPAARVSGVVRDGEGRPIAEVTVRSHAGGTTAYVPMLSAVTDAEGRFAIDDLPEEPLSLEVHKKGFARVAVPVLRVREGLEVKLLPEDPDKARRRREITEQLTQIYAEVQAAKDENERKALQQRMQELARELGELGSDGMSATAVAEPKAPEPAGR